MANVSNPVRQRMINMMYLVLTALLAINVSKEVLDGFILVNNGLEESGASMNDEMRSNYSAFENAAHAMPGRVMEYWNKAETIRAYSETLVKHITKIKAEVYAKNERMELHEVIAPNELNVDTVRSLKYAEALDNIDIISQVLVGSDPTAPKQGELSAGELKESISKYRDILIQLVEGRSPELVASLNRKFDLDDRIDASGVTQNWESYHFNEVPFAAGFTLLSKIQNDVRQAESDVVKWLRDEVNSDTFKNTVMTPAVISPSNFVVLGDSFQADVFLAAYDDKNPPVVELALEGAVINEETKEIIGPKEVLPIGPDGKAKLVSPTRGVGEFEQRGVIKLNGPEGEERFLFSSKHRVAKPALVASPSKMNVLYRHVENPVDLSVAGYTAEQIQPSIDNGSIRMSNGQFIVKPGSARKAKIFVTATDEQGNSKRFGPVEFRVKNLPGPKAFIGGKTDTDTHIRLSVLKASRRLTVALPDTDFEAEYEVVSAKMQYDSRSTPITMNLSRGLLGENSKQVIDRMRNQDLVRFTEIKARVVGTTSPIYEVGSLSLVVVR